MESSNDLYCSNLCNNVADVVARYRGGVSLFCKSCLPKKEALSKKTGCILFYKKILEPVIRVTS